MNRRVLSKFDTITVGECPGVSVEEARNYAPLDGSELNMIFEFDHMSTEYDPKVGRYGLNRISLPPLKPSNTTKWLNSQWTMQGNWPSCCSSSGSYR